MNFRLIATIDRCSDLLLARLLAGAPDASLTEGVQDSLQLDEAFTERREEWMMRNDTERRQAELRIPGGPTAHRQAGRQSTGR